MRVALRFDDGGDAAIERIAGTATVIDQVAPRLAFLVVFSAAVSHFTDFGDGLSVSVFSALSGVLPVLALAGFVELFPALRSYVAAEGIDTDPDTEKMAALTAVRCLVYILVGYLVIGEAAALWAIGIEDSSTFLFLVTCLSGLLMVGSIASAHIARYEPALEQRFDLASKRIEAAELSSGSEPAA